MEKEERMAASLVQIGVRSIRTSSIVWSERENKTMKISMVTYNDWNSTGNSRM